MKFQIKGFIFGIGVVLVLFSGYFLPTNLVSYFELFLGGSLLCVLIYILILCSKLGLRKKLLWTIALFGILPFWMLTTPYLEKMAYLHFYKKQEQNLQAAVDLLANKSQDVSIYHNRIQSKLNAPEQIDTTKLLALLVNLEVASIHKRDCFIFFEISGFLDKRRGVFYRLKEDGACSISIPKIAWVNDTWYCPVGFE